MGEQDDEDEFRIQTPIESFNLRINICAKNPPSPGVILKKVSDGLTSYSGLSLGTQEQPLPCFFITLPCRSYRLLE